VSCLFCSIVGGDVAAQIVFESETSVGFLDHRPLFDGHTLVVPREHVETLRDLPAPMVQPFFADVQRVAAAVQDALEATGTFVAANNVVSQSVPHLHFHVVPRRRKDGLRGFFWPRTTYESDDAMAATAATIREFLLSS
jgi:histidine triad (HIT) family protein